MLKERVMNFRQKILICGESSYLRDWDYGKFRQIADECGTRMKIVTTYLLASLLDSPKSNDKRRCRGCTLSRDEFVRKDADTNILKRSQNSNLDTSVTTECSPFQKRPCVRLRSPLNTSITDICTQEGPTSLRPIEGVD
ncbi:serine hydroxymethyltransferase 7 [Tanacetum coccineum]